MWDPADQGMTNTVFWESEMQEEETPTPTLPMVRSEALDASSSAP